MKKTKKIDVLVYEDRDKDGVYWVAFTEIALDAFKLWVSSVALASRAKVQFKQQKKIVSFRRKTRS